MLTSARYHPALIENLPVKPADKNTLIFDRMGKINFMPLDLPALLITAGLDSSPQTVAIDPRELGNACILYAVAMREKIRIHADLPDDAEADNAEKRNKAEKRKEKITSALIRNMNAAIENRVDVAEEIYRSWQSLSQRKDLVRQLAVREAGQPNVADIPDRLDADNIPLLSGLVIRRSLLKLAGGKDNPGFHLLGQCFDLLIRNCLYIPFETHVKPSCWLFKLDNYIDFHLYHTDEHFTLSQQERAGLEAVQLQLQKELVQQSGQWLHTLKEYIRIEIEMAADECDIKSLSPAIKNLLAGEQEDFSKDEKIRDLLIRVRECLEMRRDTIVSMFNRDGNKADFSVGLFTQAVRHAIRKAALAMKLQFEPIEVLDIPSMQYTFSDLSFAIDQQVECVGISCYRTDLFEHTLLYMAGIEEFPPKCRFYPDSSVQNMHQHFTHFFLELDLASQSMKKLAAWLNGRYGEGTAELLPNHGKELHLPCIKLQLKTMIEQFLPDWHRAMVDRLTHNKRLKLAYQTLSSESGIGLDIITVMTASLGDPYGLKNSSHFFEALLLRAFDINDTLVLSNIFQSDSRIDSILDVDIMLRVSADTASRLVTSINRQFPLAAKLLPSIDGLDQQFISLDKQTFVSDAFITLIQNTLQRLSETDAEFMKTYQTLSGTYKAPASPLKKGIFSIFRKDEDNDKGSRHTNNSAQYNGRNNGL